MDIHLNPAVPCLLVVLLLLFKPYFTAYGDRIADYHRSFATWSRVQADDDGKNTISVEFKEILGNPANVVTRCVLCSRVWFDYCLCAFIFTV